MSEFLFSFSFPFLSFPLICFCWLCYVVLVCISRGCGDKRHRRGKVYIYANVSTPLQNSDYDVFLSPLDDFKKKMEEAGLGDKVVYLDRKDRYDFAVRDR